MIRFIANKQLRQDFQLMTASELGERKPSSNQEIIFTASSKTEILNMPSLLVEQQVDFVITDFNMPLNGNVIIQHARRNGFNGLILGISSLENLAAFLAAGADFALKKPIDIEAMARSFFTLSPYGRIIRGTIAEHPEISPLPLPDEVTSGFIEAPEHLIFTALETVWAYFVQEALKRPAVREQIERAKKEDHNHDYARFEQGELALNLGRHDDFWTVTDAMRIAPPEEDNASNFYLSTNEQRYIFWPNERYKYLTDNLLGHLNLAAGDGFLVELMEFQLSMLKRHGLTAGAKYIQSCYTNETDPLSELLYPEVTDEDFFEAFRTVGFLLQNIADPFADPNYRGAFEHGKLPDLLDLLNLPAPVQRWSDYEKFTVEWLVQNFFPLLAIDVEGLPL
jgi:CheY-like chemotaxis protein